MGSRQSARALTALKQSARPPGRFRVVHSYVLREGRLTAGQRRALNELWPRYGVELPPTSASPAPCNWREHFGRDAPLHFEIGFGDGGALVDLAQAHPQWNFIGAEVHRPGVGRLLLELDARQIENVRVFCADAVAVLKRAIGESSLDAAYLYFPDPWPKKKHHKRRLIQPPFIDLLAARLRPDARIHFATDWHEYAEFALEHLTQSPHLQNCADSGGFSPRPDTRPMTKFERRGMKLGHGVWDVVMRKI